VVFALIGLLCLAGATLCAFTAAGTKSDQDALAAAKPCPVGAPWNADCLQDVEGSVSAVVPHTGRPAWYDLQTSTAAGTFSAHLPASNALVRRAVPGDAMLLTMWRGTVVAVSAYGLRAVPSDLPTSGLQPLLAGLSALTGIAIFCLQASFTFAVSYPGKPIKIRPVRKFLAAMWLGSSAVLAVNGMILGFGLDPWIDLGVVVVLLAGVAYGSFRMVRSLWIQPSPQADARIVKRAAETKIRRTKTRRTRQKTTRSRRQTIAETAYIWLGVSVCVAAIYAYAECVPGRAHDHAPICPPEVTASSCRTETTLQIRGERAVGATLDIIFVTADGSAIVARFDKSQRLETATQNAEATHSALPVELWRGGVWEIHADGKGYLRPGDPRYEVAAIVVLSASSGAFLVISRIRLRRRPHLADVPLPPWFEDAGQLAVLIAGLAFLWDGRPWGELFLAADAAWLIWSLAANRTLHSLTATQGPA
jgi:hypothetical protein